MAAPTVRDVGTVAASTGAISPGLPTGTVAGDLLLMFLENAYSNNITASGWTQAPSSPQQLTVAVASTRLTILYRVATGSDSTTTNDSGDHQIGRILGITAGTFDSANPFNTSAGDTSSTDRLVPGATTTVANCLIVAAVSEGADLSSTVLFGGWTNSNLSSITEWIDNGTNLGHGGGIGVATGTYVGPGDYGATSYTETNGTENARISLAIAPSAAASFLWSPAPPTIYRL